MPKCQTLKLLNTVLDLEKKKSAIERDSLRAMKRFIRNITTEARAVVKDFNASKDSVHRCMGFKWGEFYPDWQPRRIAMEVHSLRRKSDKRIIDGLDQEARGQAVVADLDKLQALLKRRLRLEVVVRLEDILVEVDLPGYY